MPLYDFECPKGHRFEALARMSDDTVPCRACDETAKRDEVPQHRHFDKLGTHSNLCSVRFNFNYPED